MSFAVLIGELIDDGGENRALPRLCDFWPSGMYNEGRMKVEMIAKMCVLKSYQLKYTARMDSTYFDTTALKYGGTVEGTAGNNDSFRLDHC